MFEQETLIWLSGLISTDGSVGKSSGGNCKTVAIKIASVEEDWLELMEKKLNGIGIETSILHPKNKHVKCLYLHNAVFVINLLVHNNCQEWFSPRKWHKVMVAYQYYNSSSYIPRKRWTKEEERLLMEENIEELKKTRKHQPIINKKSYMKRTKDAIRVKRERLKKLVDTSVPIHCHPAWFGSELACRKCNPVCYDKHQMGNPNHLKWCGNEKCPMKPLNMTVQEDWNVKPNMQN